MTTKTNVDIKKQETPPKVESDLEINYRIHSALLIQVKDRIKELEMILENESLLGFKMRKEILDAKTHNQKILLCLLDTSLTMDPPTKSQH